MPYTLHIPGGRSIALRWSTKDSRSSYGAGVLLERRGRAVPEFGGADILDGATFRALRDGLGAWIETDRPDRARFALALMSDEGLGHDPA